MILFKNADCIDGTGKESFIADILVKKDTIIEVSPQPLSVEEAEVVDCTGLSISPGFIDVHSHNDQLYCVPDEQSFSEPFLQQGITTVVGGNCGFSTGCCAIGTVPNLLLPNDCNSKFHSTESFFDYMEVYGMRHNMAMLAGHNTALASAGGLSHVGPSDPIVFKKTERLLEEALEAGCKGISIGLGYRPGMFCPDDEIRRISDVAIKHNAVIAVHTRVQNVFMPAVYGNDDSEPHNVRWHREFLSRYKDSGAKLQISHLVFCGTEAWKTYDAMMEVIDDNIINGNMDLWFDMYSYRQGATSVGIMLNHTPYFHDNYEDIFLNDEKKKILEQRLMEVWAKKGFSISLMMLCGAACKKYAEYQGHFIQDILSTTGMSLGEFCVDLYKQSNGFATVYFLFEQDERNVPRQMAHPHALYITDAWYEPGSHQNACAYGSMPKFLRLARENNYMTFEEAVSHMTGLSADRFSLNRRGYIRKDYAADLVVFNRKMIKELATEENPDIYPEGINYVYVNGVKTVENGTLIKTARAGRML